MQVRINNDDPFENNLIVTDLNNNGATIWAGMIAAHQVITVSCRANDSGFGFIETNADGVITRRSFLKDGEEIRL